MLFELFVIGSFWSWALIIALVISEVVAIEWDNGRAASVIALAAIVLLTLFSTFNPFAFAIQHPLILVGGAFAYLVLGTLWGVIKWYFYVLNAVDRYREFRAAFFAARGITGTEVPDQFKKEFKFSVRNSNAGEAMPPVALQNKARILMWMTYWPFSAFWTLIHDPVKRFYRFIYGRLLSTYQAISNRAFRAFLTDFAD